MNYENSREGEYLKSKDQEKQVRSLLRSRHLDMLSNCGYNVTNGSTREGVIVPDHPYYNPPGSSHSVISKAGAAVFGDGFAGKPLRMEDKFTGKRVGNENSITTAPFYAGNTY